MKVSQNDVTYIAQLANLELTSDERAGLERDLNSILEYVDRLSELDTKDVPPMAQVLAARDGAEPGDSARDDIAQGLRPSLPREEALANAPDSDGEFFLVPKVIERG